MVQLGEYFTYEEMVKSDTAKSKGIDNTPDEASIENMKALVKNVLDPVRKIWGKPLTVNSGFRSRKLNEAIGGAKTSQHMYGMAADITTGAEAAPPSTMGTVMERLTFHSDRSSKSISCLIIMRSANVHPV